MRNLRNKLIAAVALCFFSLFAVQCGAAPTPVPVAPNNSQIVDRFVDKDYHVVCWINNRSGYMFCIPEKDLYDAGIAK